MKPLLFYQRAIAFFLQHVPESMKRATIDAGLWHLERVTYARLRDRGFRPAGIIDIGAHRGEWTRTIKRFFPESPVLMVEARNQMRVELDQVTSKFTDVDYKLALLGSTERDNVIFYVQDTGSSIYPERSDMKRTTVAMKMTTLDAIAASVKKPLLLKLDVQGSELDVLRGGETTLAKAEIVQLEVPLVHYNESAPTFQDVISFMTKHGFSVYDIAGFVRPFGEHLLQLDLIFVRSQSRLRPDHFEFLSRA